MTVPIYLVGPVEVRDMKEKGEDSNQSKGRSERSTGTASKEKKAKSHRRSSKLPVPTSAGEAGADGKTSKAKKRSGSSGRHRRKKDASSSKSSRTVGSTSDGGSKGNENLARIEKQQLIFYFQRPSPMQNPSPMLVKFAVASLAGVLRVERDRKVNF